MLRKKKWEFLFYAGVLMCFVGLLLPVAGFSELWFILLAVGIFPLGIGFIGGLAPRSHREE